MKPKPRITPAWVAVFCIFLLAAYSIDTGIRQRASAIASAELQTQNFVQILEEHARQALRRVGGDLARADAALEPLLHAARPDAREARELLAALIPADRLIQSFVLLDRLGARVLTTQMEAAQAPAPGADLDYFAPHVRGADRDLVFGAPIKAVDGQWLLPVSRRLGSVNGTFGGVLVAMVRPAYLQSFYTSIDRGQDGFMTLFLSNGAAVVSSPGADARIGESWSQSALFREHLPQWPMGTVREFVAADGFDHIYSYRAMNDYPVVVTYGLSLASTLTAWQHGVWRDGLLLLAAALLLSGAALVAQRHDRLRRTAVANLKESELRLTSIIEAEPECIKIVDAQGCLVQMNPAGLGMIEANTLKQVVGRPVTDLIAPEYRAAFLDLHHRVLTGESAELTFEVLGLKGSRRWMETRAVPLLYFGQTMHLAVTRDITGRKQAETQLVLTNQRMGALIESIPDAIFLKDAQGRWLITNEPAKKLFQLDAIDWEGKTEMELAALHPAFRAAHEACLVDDEKAWQAGTLTLFSENVIDAQGRHRAYEVRKLPIFDAQGARQALVIIGRDVTDRQHADEALRIAATAFDSQQGMVITNAERQILRVNKAFTEITGYHATEAVGQYPSMLSSGRQDHAFYATLTQSLADQGAWQGEIWNRRKNGEIYPEWLTISSVQNDAGAVTHYVAIFTDISERKTAQDQIETLAFYDPLTQLPNRRLLMDRLEQALSASTRHARKSALLFVDLDNFKTLNDTLGHHQGDLLLAQVAQRLKTCVREGDTAACLGSDEFVVMLEDLSEDALETATQAETVGEKILGAFVTPFRLDDGPHHGTPSIGITLFGGEHEATDQPLRRAELAMFQAKADGRNTLRFFDAQMQAKVSAHAALEVDLREAVQQGQFVLHYQAQVVGGGHLTGVEALIRWRHPRRGMVPPAEFIPLAEETGLILPIGQWVLETACAQLDAWAQQPDTAHLTMAVNVSARQFQQADFVDKALAVLARYRVRPKLLKLELTESMLANDVEGMIAKMSALKAKGVSFSLDDFGTGYSSLSYLKRLPLDQLKIDQGFVRNIVTDPNDAAIARMVVALAESMGLAVIAEGVELQAQADFLAHQGCHIYQGYLYSRPVAIEEFESLLRKHTAI